MAFALSEQPLFEQILVYSFLVSKLQIIRKGMAIAGPALACSLVGCMV